MKKNLFATVVCAISALCASELIDLSKAGIPLEQNTASAKVLAADKGSALLKNWRVSKHLHTMEKNRDERTYQCSSSSATKNGVRFVTTADLGKITLANNAKPYFSIRLVRNIALKPEDAGKQLRATFCGVGKLYSAPTQNHLLAGIIFTGGKKPTHTHCRPKMPRKPEKITVAAPVPQGAKQAVVFLALYGAGELEISEAAVSLNEAAEAMQPDVIVATSGYSDGLFCLPYKTAFPMNFAFRRDKKFYPKQLSLVLELPQGFKVAGQGSELGKAEIKEGKVIYNAKSAFTRTITPGSYCLWRQNPVLIRAEVAPSNQFYTMRYHLEVNGKAMASHELKLKVLPFEPHKGPAFWKSGIHYPFNNALTFSADAAKEFAEMYTQSGFNAISGRPDATTAKVLKAFKVDRYGSTPAPVFNGYHIWHKVPESDSFIDITGKARPGDVCPELYAKRGGIYESYIKKAIQANFGPDGSYDHGMVNWEPYGFDYQGCFCNRCRKAFADYLKKDESEIAKIWPKKVIATYRNQWIRFRSIQHGQIVKNIQAEVREAGLADNGKKSNFVPEISYYGFNSAMDYHHAQYSMNDYASALEEICIWGPYSHKAALHEPYAYTPGQHLAMFFASRKVVEYLRSHGSKAKILGLPQGSHVTWVTTPEAIVFETLCGFVHGYSASIPYWFAYDYRYYREMARLNELLVQLEKMIPAGKKSAKVSVVPTTPIITARHWKSVFAGSQTELISPEVKDCSALQALRFDLPEGKILVAVANLWEKSPVFFKLSLPGGIDGTVTELTAKESLKCSAKQLKEGVEFGIKPLHWNFYLIEKSDSIPAKAMTQKEIEERKNKLLPAIKKAFAEEEKLLASSAQVIPEFDFGAMPEVRTGKLVAKGMKENGVQKVVIAAPRYTAVIDTANGGRLESWKIGDEEMVPPKQITGFGIVGCWMPHRRMLAGKTIVSQIKAVGDTLQIEVNRPMPHKTTLALKILYTFSEKGFEEKAQITNKGKLPTTLMTRFHTFTTQLNKGTIETEGVRLPQIQKITSFRCQSAIDAADRTLRPENTVEQKIGSCLITNSGSKVQLKFESDPLYALYMWSNPGCANSSFEPSFAPVVLKPGESKNYMQKWSFMEK